MKECKSTVNITVEEVKDLEEYCKGCMASYLKKKSEVEIDEAFICRLQNIEAELDETIKGE